MTPAAETQAPPSPPMAHAGPLSSLCGDLELSSEKATDVILGYLNFFALGAPGNWATGDAPGGFLCTNNGIRALLKLLKELISFIESKDCLQAHTMAADEILEKVKPYVEPLVKFFANADPVEVKGFRSRQALDGVKKNCFGMMGVISESKPDFTNQELKDHLASRDIEGTSISRKLIDEVNVILFKDVLTKLRAHYGEDKDTWWWQGIPPQTRDKCDGQVNRDNGLKERWQYLSLADYQTIIPKSWELFEEQYNLFGKNNKPDKISWIGRINKIRQTTHHPEKGIISKDEVVYVKDVHRMVLNKIQKA